MGLAAFAPLAAAEAQEPYRLGPQDKLRIYVHEWTALNGEFDVGPDGKLSLPVVGEVTVAGATTAEAADAISERLKAKANLRELPNTAVDIARYRPIYVLGSVDKPGEYAFRPGMNVLKAVAIAGGFYRPSDASAWNIERDSITAMGDASLMSFKRRASLARIARLKAEAAGSKAIEWPPELRAVDETILAREEALFKARREAHENEIEALKKTISLFEDEIKSLQAQIEAQQAQAAAVERELKEVRGFVSKRLAPTSRILPLEQAVAQIVGRQREFETALIRAKQQISLAQQKIVGLADQRRADARGLLQKADGELADAAQKQRTARELVALSGFAATRGESRRVEYRIVRESGSKSERLEGDATTALRPGDIVEVLASHDAFDDNLAPGTSGGPARQGALR